MKDDVKITYTITPAWQVIENIRKKIKERLGETVKEMVDPTVIVASELCENAIKYGASVPKMERLEFLLHIVKNRIKIQVKNGIASQKDFENVKNFIDSIHASDNPGELYINRLKELMAKPHSGESQLGLFRIIYETGFKLRYSYQDKVLTIIAETSF